MTVMGGANRIGRGTGVAARVIKGMRTPRDRMFDFTRLRCGAGYRLPTSTGAGTGRRAVVRNGKGTMAESYNGYCVKCKDKRDFDGDIAETNGRRMAKGTCPVCGTRMNRILGKA
jgi:uncharacterized protein DUF5679